MLDILLDASMLVTKLALTHMAKDVCLHKKNGDLLDDLVAYKCLIGHLLYLTATRPDIIHVIQQLNQYLSCPTSIH